jgi:hypothetical protein
VKQILEDGRKLSHFIRIAHHPHFFPINITHIEKKYKSKKKEKIFLERGIADIKVNKKGIGGQPGADLLLKGERIK